jgi:hypothetical protein
MGGKIACQGLVQLLPLLAGHKRLKKKQKSEDTHDYVRLVNDASKVWGDYDHTVFRV